MGGIRRVMPEITVHHLERSRSHRILWMLEELDLPYTIRHYARDPVTLRAPASLREVHPLGKSPVVTLDGEVLAESGAIVERLVADFGPHLRPTDPQALQRYRFFLHYAEGSLMPPLLVSLVLSRLTEPPVPFFARPITGLIARQVHAAFSGPELDRHFAFVESSLGEHPWFAGPAFSAADVQMSYAVEAGVARVGRTAAQAPNTFAWIDRIRARPAYQRALERGGEPVIGA